MSSTSRQTPLRMDTSLFVEHYTKGSPAKSDRRVRPSHILPSPFMKKLFNIGIRNWPMVLLAIAITLAVWEGFPGQRRILLESIAQITSRMQGLLDLSNWGAMSWI